MAEDEFAPGIPASRAVHPFPTVSKPKTFEFAIHEHKADRAGLHYDLRIGDPATGHAHSWALKELPKPGQLTTAVQQPTHTVKYMDFAGKIEEGYGKGEVALHRRDKAEVIHADDKTIRFATYPGREIEEYALRKMKDGGWALQNVSTDRSVGPAKALPDSKPKYKTRPVEKIKTEAEGSDLQAKIDGAHVLFQFKSPGSLMRVHSYRPTERQGGVIEHTHKLPDFHELRTPNALKDTIIRGELYAVDKNGKALPAAKVGGLLNAGVWKSRQMQEEQGKLVPVVFDVVRYKGQDVSELPYAQKKKILGAVTASAPWLSLPRTATTPEEKHSLIQDIRAGKEPSTREGVVEWHHDKPLPTKAKFQNEQDVFVREIFPEAGNKRSGTLAGGFAYSKTPSGPTVGRVGTGFSHALKKSMLSDPDQYTGLKARVKAHPETTGEALRMPAFVSFHLEQDMPANIKTGSVTGELGGKPANVDSVKSKTEFQGIPIHLDRPKGFVMRGTDKSGTPWERTYKYDYGFIPKTLGGDGDGLDVFIGPDKNAPEAYWAVQTKPDGAFDEYKVFLGFKSRDAATECYKEHIPAKLLKNLVTMRIEMMKAMLGLEPDGLIKKTAGLVKVSFLSELQAIREVQCAGFCVP